MTNRSVALLVAYLAHVGEAGEPVLDVQVEDGLVLRVEGAGGGKG